MADAATIEIPQPVTKKPPVGATTSTSEESLILTLAIEDPDVTADLRRYPEGSVRTSFAISALRIGILSIRQAQGHVDTQALRNEGQRLLSDLSHELESRVGEIDTRIAAALKQYFDPTSGHFTERLERLVKKDGDLERVLRQQIGDAENSELARALANRIGENSPLMRRLDPEDAESITMSIEKSVKDVLEAEQERILTEFSLDNEHGALNRVVAQLTKTNGEFKGDIEEQITRAVKEFSLDDEQSALSRLVKRVEDANHRIAAEFSEDNEESALNKLNSALSETKQAIEDNLTLDSDDSALARLRKNLMGVLDDIREKNAAFQQDVSSKLSALITKRAEEQRSTTHGLSFEEECCAFLQKEAQRGGDLFSAVGTKPGALPKCKKGDAVIEQAPEAVAAGERIVFEAKGDKSYTLEDARAEIETARKNRNAAVGVFVFSKDRAPAGLPAFTRIDCDLFVCWDSGDPSFDVYLSAAVSVAKALLFKQKLAERKSDGDLKGIEVALNVLEQQLKGLDDIETWTLTIQSNSGKVLKTVKNIREGAAERVADLRRCLEAFRSTQHYCGEQ